MLKSDSQQEIADRKNNRYKIWNGNHQKYYYLVYSFGIFKDMINISNVLEYFKDKTATMATHKKPVANRKSQANRKESRKERSLTSEDLQRIENLKRIERNREKKEVSHQISRRENGQRTANEKKKQTN